MPSALLVDTSFSSWPILEALERRGITVHVVGGNPADALAKAHPRYHVVDYSDTQALARLVDVIGPDHLVPGCNDRSYIACAEVAQARHFTGIDTPANTRTINDKSLFRAAATCHGMSVPRVFDWPREAPDCAVIVKPVDAFSGRGVTVVAHADAAEIHAAVDKAKAESRSGYCLVEEFVEGPMYSHSAFLSEGRIAQDFWIIEHSSVNPFVVDTSHLALDLDPAVQDALRTEVERMAAALGLVDGLFHSQFIVSGKRHVVVEATRRCPGDLYSQLVQLSTGFDYPDAYAAPYVGARVTPADTAVKAPRFIMRHTLTGDVTTSLQHVQFQVPVQIERWVPLGSSGDLLRPSPQGRIAILFARASSQEALLQLAEATTAHALYRINQGLEV